MPIATTNPATGQLVKSFSALTDAELDGRLQAAADGFRALGATSFADRAGWMRQAADILDAENEQIAAMMVTEMGKTLVAARAEVAAMYAGRAADPDQWLAGLNKIQRFVEDQQS